MAVNRVKRNGSYAPLSAHYYKDDAIDEAGESAELLYVRGLAFCADVLSDGFISDRQLVRFVGVGMFDAPDRADRLVEVGLWGRVDGGYEVRSWLDWNRSREEITDAQAKDAQRKRPAKDSEPPDATPPGGGRRRSAQTPNGNQTESDSTSGGDTAGVRADSTRPSSAGARARSTTSNSTTDPDTSSSETAPPPSDGDEEPAGNDEPQRDDVDALCSRLRDWMLHNEVKPPTVGKRWKQQARLLLDTDKRELSKALNLIDWCQQHHFWKSNIHSIAKFRDQYDKLALQAREEWRRNGGRLALVPEPVAPSDPDAAFADLRDRAAGSSPMKVGHEAASLIGRVFMPAGRMPGESLSELAWNRDRAVEFIDANAARIREAYAQRQAG